MGKKILIVEDDYKSVYGHNKLNEDSTETEPFMVIYPEGKWEILPKSKFDSSPSPHIRCTNCGTEPFGDIPSMFCPNCGARMIYTCV